MQPWLNCAGFICKCGGTWCFHGNLSAATLLCRLNVVSVSSTPLLQPFITHDGGTQWRTGWCLYQLFLISYSSSYYKEGKFSYELHSFSSLFRKNKCTTVATLIYGSSVGFAVAESGQATSTNWHSHIDWAFCRWQRRDDMKNNMVMCSCVDWKFTLKGEGVCMELFLSINYNIAALVTRASKVLYYCQTITWLLTINILIQNQWWRNSHKRSTKML